MNNFYYYNPTKIIFGKGMIENIVREIPKHKKILIIHGVSSIKKNGVYNTLREVLKTYQVYEFGGVGPNPDCDTAAEIVNVIRDKNIDFLLAVGGGSVIDMTKFVSLAANYPEENNPWDFLKDKSKTPSNSIEFGVILTIPATGSEMNNAFVISNKKTCEKLVASAYTTYPEFSVLDPSFALSLSRQQMLNGIIDTYIHILEQYMTCLHDGFVQDSQSEAFLKTIISIAPKLLDKSRRYEDLATFTWVAAQVSSGILCRGVPVDWSSHEISHQITAITNLDHAKALALVLFGVWENQFESKKEKLAKYSKNVLDYEGADPKESAQFAISETQNLFKNWGMDTKLSDYDISCTNLIGSVIDYFKKNRAILGENNSITYKNIEKILQSRVNA